MAEPVDVVRVHVVAEGAITSDFRGFSSAGTLFEIQGGGTWEQAEHNYDYHYAYRPTAVVVDGINGVEPHVEGMDGAVKVRRVS